MVKNKIDCLKNHVVRVTTGVRGIGEGDGVGIMSMEKFREHFLSNPCFCCRSEKHSLLEECPAPRTRSGKRKYKYQCQVADGEALYPTRSEDELDITFHLSAERFARDCDYNFNDAVARMSSYFIREGEGIAHYARHFYTVVKDLCLSHMGAVNTIEA